MRIFSGKKRLIGRVLIAVALGFFFSAGGNAQNPDKAAKPNPTPTCPLPANYGVDQAVSPEKPLFAVCHNGTILCLSRSAARAHVQQGDTPLGPCSKPGSNGPCP